MQKRHQYYRTAVCEVCHQTFQTARYHAKTCSPKCRKKLSRAGQENVSAGKSVTGVTLQQLEMLVKEIGI